MVLDGAQKIKSSKNRMTHEVKGLSVDFSPAMNRPTVENRLADLWCIADVVQPAALGDLWGFSRHYENEGVDVQGLRLQVWQEEDSTDERPKLLLRPYILKIRWVACQKRASFQSAHAT